jgi:hypothetical protein
MALDPKQVLQRNIPLVTCYVLALVPVILWVVVVVEGVEGGPKDSYKSVSMTLRSKKAALEGIAKNIQSDASQVYTPDHKKLISDRDLALERWLPAVGELPKDKVPTANQFQTVLNTAVDGLKTTYGDIVVDSTNPAKPFFVALEPVADGTQKKIQKQFWICERILISLKKASTVTPSDATPIRLVSNIEFGTSGQGNTPPGQAKPLMAPIPAKITLTMTLKDLPKVLRELLAQDIVFRLKTLHTELLPFSFANPKLQLVVNPDPKPLYEQTIYNATPQSPADVPADLETVFPEPKLKVTIELEAIDFDMDAINPAPAPAK